MTADLRNQVYALLDSVLIGEYGLTTRCSGMMLLFAEDLPDGGANIDGLSDAEIRDLFNLIRSWDGAYRFAEIAGGFMAVGVEPEGHRVLVWGRRRNEELIAEGWIGWLGEERLPTSLSSRAANFAHHVLQEMMRQGVIRSVQAPLHFGWQEEALDSLRFCSLSASEYGVEFPEDEVKKLLNHNLAQRGFGFLLRDGILVWLVVEVGPEGFTVVTLFQHQLNGPGFPGFGVVAQA